MYVIYLRKSRSDIEAENNGGEETLARHKKALMELATQRNLEVGAIYQEVVSGDSISSRPEIQKLLREVSAGVWEGVIVMEIERLARGDTIDQGIVVQTFKYSCTKIITPQKVYDPNNEFDETFFEFNLFMSRQEYKTIRRRMTAGRINSTKEGNYIYSKPPYGYRRVQLPDRSFSLEPIPELVPVIQMVYDMYVNRDMGFGQILNELNALGLTYDYNGQAKWSVKNISRLIHNPTYKGYTAYGRTKMTKELGDNGQIEQHKRVSRDTAVYAKGKHQAIVTEDIWDRAQEIATKRFRPPLKFETTMVNQFAGIIFCGICGGTVRRQQRAEGYSYIYCKNRNCKCLSSHDDIVVNAVNQAIANRLKEIQSFKVVEKPSSVDVEVAEAARDNASKELTAIKKQKAKIYELYEREVYDDDEFNERISTVKQREAELSKILKVAPVIHEYSQEEIEFIFKDAIKELSKEADARHLNNVYKSIIRRITYAKTPDEFKIDVDFLF